jgi:hypothetical protein
MEYAKAAREAVRSNDAWPRRIVMLAIVLLVLHGVGAWSYSVLGAVAAFAAALLVVAVSVLSARMAGSGNDAWFVVPTLVFTALPLAGRLWTLSRSEASWWARAVEISPFLIGFAAPVLLLLAAHLRLGSRAARLS